MAGAILLRIAASELLRALEHGGWFMVRQEGRHAQLKHPTRPGRVTVALLKQQIIDAKTLRSALGHRAIRRLDLRVDCAGRLASSTWPADIWAPSLARVARTRIH